MNCRSPKPGPRNTANVLGISILLGSSFMAFAMMALAGCSMCCGPHDYDYPVMGGPIQRTDPQWGRVGSIFSDPNAGFYGPSADSNLQSIESAIPTDIDDYDSNDGLDMDQRPDTDELKAPVPDDDSNSARRWQNRPLRSTGQWR